MAANIPGRDHLQLLAAGSRSFSWPVLEVRERHESLSRYRPSDSAVRQRPFRAGREFERVVVSLGFYSDELLLQWYTLQRHEFHRVLVGACYTFNAKLKGPNARGLLSNTDGDAEQQGLQLELYLHRHQSVPYAYSGNDHHHHHRVAVRDFL